MRLTGIDIAGARWWIYGKQVELAVPSDIIFYRTGREFVAWQRLDGESKDRRLTRMRARGETGKLVDTREEQFESAARA